MSKTRFNADFIRRAASQLPHYYYATNAMKNHADDIALAIKKQLIADAKLTPEELASRERRHQVLAHQSTALKQIAMSDQEEGFELR